LTGCSPNWNNASAEYLFIVFCSVIVICHTSPLSYWYAFLFQNKHTSSWDSSAAIYPGYSLVCPGHTTEFITCSWYFKFFLFLEYFKTFFWYSVMDNSNLLKWMLRNIYYLSALLHGVYLIKTGPLEIGSSSITINGSTKNPRVTFDNIININMNISHQRVELSTII